jgi:diguanylate cyclase (GGDEF)-like protein
MRTFNVLYTDSVNLSKDLEKIDKNKEIFIQIFSGVLEKEKILEIIKVIKEKIPRAKIIGSTTDGEIFNENIKLKSIVININEFDKTKVETFFLEKNKKSFDMGLDVGKASKDKKLLITFADGLNVNGEEYLKGIRQISGVTVAGGLAGDNDMFKETFVFNEEGFGSHAVVGALFEGDIIVNNTYGFNWEGIGKLMKITKSRKNIVYEIDGKKAADVYREYFGDVANDIVKIGVEFPLIINRGNLKIARAVLSENEDGSLMFGGNIEEGSSVQFGYGDINNILQKDKTLFSDMGLYDVESIFIYSCMARRRFLGEDIKYEIEPFSQIAPVSGFFTYGEFISLDGDNHFLNQTMTILALSENKKEKKSIKYDFKKTESLTLKALINLIKNTSDELTKANETLEERVKEKVEEIEAKNRKLKYMLYHDKLTSVYNKFKLEEDLKKHIYGGVLFDIRNFSAINDLYGEIVGDEVLRAFVKRLFEIIDKNLNIYRINSDQFLIISRKKTDLFRIVTDFIESLKKRSIYIYIDDTQISFDIEITAAVIEGDYKDIKLKADLTLKEAKKRRVNILKYSEELRLEENLKKEVKIIEMVKSALKEDRVVPVFQKIVKGKECYYECLVRIKENDRLIPPALFLNVVTPTEYYYEITKTMIYKSFVIFSKRDEKISINFSYKDISNQNVINYLIEKIKEFNMQGRVIIELLESENLHDFQVVERFIEQVKIFGVSIAIDDFGSGYSNFVYLTKIVPHIIKIDGSIIKNIHTDKNSYIIAENINDFAHKLGCKTVAEFVSDENIFANIEKIGIDGVQGYFIDIPKEIK